MKEVDLMLGRFADKHARDMTAKEISEFESLLELPDPDIYNWIVGAEPVPTEYDTKTLRQLIEFYRVA
jgi:antitoxin CptB